MRNNIINFIIHLSQITLGILDFLIGRQLLGPPRNMVDTENLAFLIPLVDGFLEFFLCIKILP